MEHPPVARPPGGAAEPPPAGGVGVAVLGGLSLYAGGEAVKLKRQQQILLTQLLLPHVRARGDTASPRVSLRTIEDALWPEGQLPTDARNSIQVAVTSLRRVFGRRPGAPRILHGDDRYALEIEPTRIDAVRFSRLAARGRQLLRHAPRPARAMLREAIEAYDGTPFGDDLVDTGLVARYEEVRVQAQTDLNEANLAIGDAPDLPDDIARQLAARGDDEVLHGQLVRALWADGQSFAAQGAIAAARDRFAILGDELERLSAEINRELPAPSRRGRDQDGAARARRDAVVVCAVLDARGRRRGDPRLGTASLIADDHGGRWKAAGEHRLLAVFDDVADALDAARAMAAFPRLHARLAAPPGAAFARDDACAGPGPSRAWRLAAAAHPEQVLLSSEAQAQTRTMDAAPPLADLGAHRFADLLDPEPIFALAHPHGRELPPPRALAGPTNLPLATTRFIGRWDDLDRLTELVGNHDVVTLTGPGGAGKTRLAQQLAAHVLDSFDDGAWFVDLAQLDRIATVDDVAASVAMVLGVRPLAGEDPLDTLAKDLAGTQVLVILDNAEHVQRACAELVIGIRAASRGLRIVVTSRKRLDVAGERVYELEPLANDAPAPGQPSDAILLLLERGGLLARGTDISAAELAAAHRICSALELPLAIELAAGQVPKLKLEGVAADVAAMLAEGGDLDQIASGDPTLPARHRSLSASIGWSYGLLEADEQLVLHRLAVFRGTFSREDAAVVAGLEPMPGTPPRRVLSRLVEQSLVAPAPGGRLRLLDSIRAFAHLRLELHLELDRVRDRHAERYLSLARTQAPRLFGPDEKEALDLLEAEHLNIGAALAWLVETRRAPEALELVAACWWWLFSFGHWLEGGAMVDAALAIDDAPGRSRVRVLRAGSHLAWWRGEHEAAARFNDALAACADEIDDPWGRAWAQMGTGAVALFHAPEDALTLLEDSRRRFEDLDRPWEAGYCRQIIGGAYWWGGDPAAARAAFREAVGIFRRLGHRSVLASVTRSEGLMAARCGNAAEGADLCRHALDMSDALGDPAGSAQALNYLGSINRDQGQHAAAAARHARALQLAHQAGERWGTCLALDGLAGTALVDGEWTVAVHLLAYSQKLAQRAGYMPAPHELQARDADVARARAERSLAEFQGAWARGADADETEIVAYALTFARRYVSDPGRFRPRSASRATLASPDVELPAFEPAPGGAR